MYAESWPAWTHAASGVISTAAYPAAHRAVLCQMETVLFTKCIHRLLPTFHPRNQLITVNQVIKPLHVLIR